MSKEKIALSIALVGSGLLMICRAEQSQERALYRVHSVADVVRLFPTTVAELDARVAAALTLAREERTAILALEPQERTFANTAQALDRLVSMSDAAILASVAQVLTMVSPNSQLREAAGCHMITITNFFVEAIANNQELYQAFTAYIQGNALGEPLTLEQQYYNDQTMQEFRANGLDLAVEKRERILALKKELVALEQTFELAIAQDASWIAVLPAQLAGLDAYSIAQFPRQGAACLVGVDYPTYNKVMQECQVSDTRRQLYNAFENRAYPSNKKVLEALIAKRDELAQLLGFESFAHYNLDQEMVEHPHKATTFLYDILARARIKEEREFARMTQELPEGVQLCADGTINPWDWAYIKNCYKKQHFAINDQVIAEYFPMENTIQELLDIYRQFFGLEFKQLPVQGVWHADVKLIQVVQQSRVVGYLLLDLFPREAKYSHACECSIVKAVMQTEGAQFPVVAVVIANFPKPTADKPALLPLSDVKTFFHEFGHALHEILGRTPFGSLSGTSTKRDFVELPSQMLEEWLSDTQILKKVSKHYVTGEPLPDGMAKTLAELTTFDSGDFTTRQVFLALFALHCFAAGGNKDLDALYQELYKQIRRYQAYQAQAHMYAAFGHLTGYGARYYGYLWSKVFALDIFAQIKQEGLLNPVVGARYTAEILHKGGSQNPQEMLEAFLGRKPTIDAFCASMGFVPETAALDTTAQVVVPSVVRG